MNSTRTYVIIFIIISIVSSIMLYIIYPPQFFILFFLIIALSIIITLTIKEKNFNYKIKLRATRINTHIILIVTGIILMVMQLTNIYVEIINAILYILVFILLPGFSLLSIVKLKRNLCIIQHLAILYPLSLALLTIFGAMSLTLSPNIRGISILSFIILLSLFSLMINKKENQTENNNCYEITIRNNDLILIFNIIIFAYFYMELYPKIVVFTGLDISRNYLYALGLTKDELGSFYYINTIYPIFSIYQSTIFYVIKPSVEIFQLTTVFLNIFIIITFYAMSDQYLKKYGEYTSAIATLIWSTFAGFGWFNYLTQMINNPNASFLSLIEKTNAYSYGDITWRRLFFNLSMETSFTLVFAVLYLLKRNDLSRIKQIFLMSLIMTPLSLMHPYGTYLLFSTLLCFAFISSEELKQQLKNASYSMLMASLLGFLLNYVLSMETPGLSINFLTLSLYLLVGMIILALTTLRDRPIKKLTEISKRILNFKYGELFIVSLLILYLASLLSWFNGSLTFNFTNLNRFGYVPWALYPVKLGMTGILTIIALYLIFKDPHKYSRDLVALFASVLFMIVVSRLVSSIQMQYVSQFTFDLNSSILESIRKNFLSFREERMFEVFKPGLAVIASIVFSKQIQMKIRDTKLSTKFAVTGFVLLILISGISSTLLGFEYYHKTVNENQPNPLELDAISTLRNVIYANGKSIIISPLTSPSNLDFTGATAIVGESPAAWASKSPEFPLFVTRFTETTPTYIYLHKTRDYQKISDYAGNYLERISDMAQTCFENQKVQIKMINNISTPTPLSSTALIIPNNQSRINDIPSTSNLLFYAYDFLSLAGFNYTTILSDDNTINDYETLILPYDDLITHKTLIKLQANQQTKPKNIVILNTNGYGPLIDLFGDVSYETFTANQIYTNRYFKIQPIDLPIIKNNNSEVKARYVNGSLSSPFIMTTTRNQLNLIYVNMYPLIQLNQFSNQPLLQSLKEIMGKYIGTFNEKTVSPWFQEQSLLFTELKANGKISVLSGSATPLRIQKNSTVVIHTETTSTNLINVTNISIEGYDNVQIESTEISVQNGYGFYTTLTAHNPSIILHGDENTCITTGNDKVKGRILRIEINGNVTFLIRQPEITINGDTLFKNFKMMHPSHVYSDGRSTTLSGNITLNIYVSDEATIALPYKLNSPITVKYKTPIMEFNEATLLLSIIPSIFPILIVMSIIVLILARVVRITIIIK